MMVIIIPEIDKKNSSNSDNTNNNNNNNNHNDRNSNSNSSSIDNEKNITITIVMIVIKCIHMCVCISSMPHSTSFQVKPCLLRGCNILQSEQPHSESPVVSGHSQVPQQPASSAMASFR